MQSVHLLRFLCQVLGVRPINAVIRLQNNAQTMAIVLGITLDCSVIVITDTVDQTAKIVSRGCT